MMGTRSEAARHTLQRDEIGPMVRLLFAWLFLSGLARAQELHPRLLALVKVPQGTLRGWVQGQYFGIDGLWDYNDAVESREWAWWGPGRTVFQPLPRKEYIVYVDGRTLTAFYQDGDDYMRCRRWSRAADGVYRDTPAPRIRRYGSDVSNAFPSQVNLPAYGESYEIFEGGLLRRHHGHILYRRLIPGLTRQNVLRMQPKKHQILALGDDTQLLLLDTRLHTLAKLRLGKVRNFQFESNGERLAVVTRDDRLWILELFPRLFPDKGMAPRAELKTAEFERLAAEWEKRTGRSWWWR